MKIVDGRGKNMVKVKSKNRAIITDFFKENPKKTATDCSKKTGLSYKTVLNHLTDFSESET